MTIREIIGNNGQWEPVGVDERPIFTLTSTNWGSSPTSVTLAAFTWAEATDTYTVATTTICPTGSVSVSGNVITLPVFVPPVEGTKVRVEIKFTVSSSVVEAFRWILVER